VVAISYNTVVWC